VIVIWQLFVTTCRFHFNQKHRRNLFFPQHLYLLIFILLLKTAFDIKEVSVIARLAIAMSSIKRNVGSLGNLKLSSVEKGE
jgi:hypothetical protein